MQECRKRKALYTPQKETDSSCRPQRFLLHARGPCHYPSFRARSTHAWLAKNKRQRETSYRSASLFWQSSALLTTAIRPTFFGQRSRGQVGPIIRLYRVLYEFSQKKKEKKSNGDGKYSFIVDREVQFFFARIESSRLPGRYFVWRGFAAPRIFAGAIKLLINHRWIYLFRSGGGGYFRTARNWSNRVMQGANDIFGENKSLSANS